MNATEQYHYFSDKIGKMSQPVIKPLERPAALLTKIYRKLFKKKLTKTASILLVVATGVIVLHISSLLVSYYFTRPPQLPYVSYTDFVEKAVQREIEEKVFYNKTVKIFLPAEIVTFTFVEDGTKAWTYFSFPTDPRVGSAQEELRRWGYDVHEVVIFPWGFRISQAIDLLVQGLLFVVFIWFIWGGGLKNLQEEMSATRYSRKMVGQPVYFTHVAGQDHAKKEVAEIVEYLHDSSRFRRLKASLPRGVLLTGPPGNGKSLLARAVGWEAKVPIFWTSGSDFHEMFVGVGAKRAAILFEEAIRNAPSIIVIDEIDSAAPSRSLPDLSGGRERASLVNKLLSLLSQLEQENLPVFVIGITNLPEVLDRALIRPGRFDRQIEISLPDKDGRKEILEIHFDYPEKKPISSDVNSESLADETYSFSGAQLATLVNEAALRAGREGRDIILEEDFLNCIERVMLGLEKDTKLSNEAIEMLAYHEAGHALISEYCPNLDPLKVITIKPRGGSLGYVWRPEREERYTESEERFRAQIKAFLAGRAVEKVCLGKIDSGARDDIKKATLIAHNMVYSYGMSEKMGPIFLDDSGGQSAFLSKKWSEKILAEADEEVLNIVQESFKEVCDIYSQEEAKRKIDAVAKVLIEKKRMTLEEIREALNGISN